ncbi:MAG TPA: hypothetical protein VKT77_11745 [Chthonomonadaceae bacterium]|nr:hypothetical protein [Chthonomonadaceae bacterium]
MNTTHRAGIGLTATMGLSALLLGFAGSAPSRADDFDTYPKDHVYREIADVRRDERELRDLQERHDEARRLHDWPRMHEMDRRIADLKWHLRHDRRELRSDLRHDRLR